MSQGCAPPTQLQLQLQTSLPEPGAGVLGTEVLPPAEKGTNVEGVLLTPRHRSPKGPLGRPSRDTTHAAGRVPRVSPLPVPHTP